MDTGPQGCDSFHEDAKRWQKVPVKIERVEGSYVRIYGKDGSGYPRLWQFNTVDIRHARMQLINK